MSLENNTPLKRSISLPLVSLYGLGNILGAGIYVLIGKVAAAAGYFAPLAFVLASLVAAITAFSFAELSSRYPKSAGGALYVHKGFAIPRLTVIVGILIVLTGIVSSATISKGFVGYLQIFIATPDWLIIIGLLTALCLLASWGISESVSAAAAFTIIEIIGLVLVVSVVIPVSPEVRPEPVQTGFAESVGWTGLLSGAFLAFYAYVGFEDMVNVAEEVKKPSRNMPLAILIALGAATFLYVVVAYSSLLVLSPAELSNSDAPMAAVYESATGNNPWIIAVISMFAVVNGALIQIIMGSRVCYGLARENLLPKFIGRVNPKTQTPINATVLLSLVIVIAALWLPIETLARTTTTLLLLVFSLVNFALIRIKRRDGNPEGIFEVPIQVPVAGAFLCLVFLIAEATSLISA